MLSIKMSNYSSSSGMDSGSSEAPLEVETKQLQSDLVIKNEIIATHGKNFGNEKVVIMKILVPDEQKESDSNFIGGSPDVPKTEAV